MLKYILISLSIISSFLGITTYILKQEIKDKEIKITNLKQTIQVNKENCRRKLFEIEQKTIIDTMKRIPYEDIPISVGQHTINF